ncbi:l-amino acid oxidase [Diplodia corticola]|uniref:L-amino acid oxidase n=1 Tax=Diplodia corticola TaxID=236234 RepID=A0A1J9RC39_9PEZI|nr:l-amino acid oxidase [Diplodia corticola]OJD38025.1 l-amino acid oxidase [Diplodia corticola]
MNSTAPSTIHDAKAEWARLLVRQKIADELNVLKARSDNPIPPEVLQPPDANRPYAHDNLPLDQQHEAYSSRPSQGHDGSGNLDKIGAHPPGKVCIVGAGVAGLFIAMMLDTLGIPYDILEANERIGGRVYTHRFGPGPHDYYDVGAMRFPDIPIMQLAFELFDYLKLPKIPYYLEGENCPKLFNNRFFVKGEFDPHHVSEKKGGQVPDHVVDCVNHHLNEAFSPYKQAMKKCFREGFDELMKVDDYSTREFLKRGGPGGKLPQYNFFAIQWMETQDTSTNLYDQAFSESVMDSLDFDYPVDDKKRKESNCDEQEIEEENKVKWYCIEGGTSLLTDSMHHSLTTKAETNKRVDTISWDKDCHQEDNMWVKCAEEEKPRRGYHTVFNTTPLGCLGRMDLRGLKLHPSQKDAIRSLHYDDSAKVALQFDHPWWITECGIKKGGVASTDLPLRTCVYPSYNLHDRGPAVLLASYTWAQDATRIGSVVGPPNEDELVEMLLGNLALLHSKFTRCGEDENKYEHMYKLIKEAYKGVHHAYSWSHDSTAAGAFALFGPGQFRHLYPYLTRPAADGKFHMVGEASSAHHAWIVGALDSALAATQLYLHRFGKYEHIAVLREKWGNVAELDMGEKGSAHLQILLGSLPKKFQVKI